MNILTTALKRNILFILLLLSLVQGSAKSPGCRRTSPRGLKQRTSSLTEENLNRHDNEFIQNPDTNASQQQQTIITGNNTGESSPTSSSRSSSSSVQQQPLGSSVKENELKSARVAGYMDFQTKLLLVCFSIFMLIFVLMLLIIGHFTWFADIRQKLEEEWEQELKAEEEKRSAKNILDEMKNPFDDKGVEGKEDSILVDRRRESTDSTGCALGLCVPPHHSILCPNNVNVPSLTDPLFKRDTDVMGSILDPIEYRDQRSSTEWMNLESCVKISEPVPVRENIRGFPANFSTSSLGIKRPMTPMTPDPTETVERVDRHRIVDVEMAGILKPRDTNSNPPLLSPELKFDLSKLDMF